MRIWSPLRVTAFLAIWALVTPVKVMLYPPRLDLSVIYAGLWLYLPGGNPFSESPFVLSPIVIVSMLPFCVPGFAVSWYAWRSAKDENLTRGGYFQVNLLLVVIQALLALAIPCPTEFYLCVPTPTTGIVALLFVSRIVKEIEGPWSESETNNESMD
jgi:hypothetical protein